MKHNALIGYTGFVGNTLRKQTTFESLYNSKNIQDIENRDFSTVVCAGAPAQKWVANSNPEEDRRNIENLISHLMAVTCDHFILISTVDVFQSPVGVNEETPVDEEGLHPYGLNRRRLEKFVQTQFPNSLIVRLPGLVGPGLRKNIIFDFLNDNNLELIESRGIYQFYPMVNLWYDIEKCISQNISLVHLTSEPISVADVSAYGFGKPFKQEITRAPARYDMQSKYASLFGSGCRYQYCLKDTIQAIRSYAQFEPVTVKKEELGI